MHWNQVWEGVMLFEDPAKAHFWEKATGRGRLALAWVSYLSKVCQIFDCSPLTAGVGEQEKCQMLK